MHIYILCLHTDVVFFLNSVQQFPSCYTNKLLITLLGIVNILPKFKRVKIQRITEWELLTECTSMRVCKPSMCPLPSGIIMWKNVNPYYLGILLNTFQNLFLPLGFSIYSYVEIGPFERIWKPFPKECIVVLERIWKVLIKNPHISLWLKWANKDGCIATELDLMD